MMLRFLTAIVAIGWPTSPTLYQLSGPPRSGLNPFALRTSANPAPPPALVQQIATGGSDAGDSVAVNLTAPSVAGNALIVCISHVSTTSINSVTTIGSVPLAQAVIKSGTGIVTEIWIATNVASDDGVTVSATATGQLQINLSEWSGLNSAGAEATNTNSGVASTAVTTNSVTPVSTHNLVIASGGWTANNYSSGPTNSFTRMTPIGGATSFQESAYLIQTAATSKSTGWTLSAGINWAAAVAVFGAP